jgi:ABC-type multidrug transport system fused ATPase/permease subunit
MVFAGSMFLIRSPGPLTPIRDLPVNTTIDLLSILAQVLAALVGFLIVFLVLAIQFVALERSRWHDISRDKIEKLAALAARCPAEIPRVRRILLDLHIQFEAVSAEQEPLVVNRAEFKTRFEPLLQEFSEYRDRSARTMRAFAFMQEAAAVSQSIFDIYGKASVAWVGSVVLPVDFLVLPKLLVLLFTTVALIPFLGGDSVPGALSDLRIPTVLALLTFFAFVLLEAFGSMTRLMNELLNWR